MFELRMRLRTFSVAFLLLAVGMVTLAAGPASAALSKSSIDSLRELGRQEGWTFEVGENDATQYTIEQLTGFRMPKELPTDVPVAQFPPTAVMELPSAFDWRTEVGLPPIRNQGGCGSCWAFATVGAFECNIKIKDGKTVDLSEQYLVNCNRSGWGCDGGWWAHDMHKNRTDQCGGSGAVLEQYAPYYANDGACTCPYPHDYKIDNWGYVSQQWATPSVADLKQAILLYGPVSVAVYVNNAFQAYRGGVFNGCQYGTVNHAVVLVGWDDSQGAGGVWIMRNSWGTGWGEAGYMRIPYNCSQIGYNATWVEYKGSVWLTVDSALAKAPADVSFTGQSTLDATSWLWDFGDGGSSTLQNPTHRYTSPGCYDVALTAQTSQGSLQSLYRQCVSLHADTLRVTSVGANGGETAVLDVYLRNYLSASSIEIPLQWGEASGMRLDSASTVGLRSDFMATKQFVHISNTQAFYVLYSGLTQPALAAGSGPVVRLYFSVPAEVDGGDIPVRLEPYETAFGKYDCRLVNDVGEYCPDAIAGAVRICVPGDVNNNGFGPDLSDLSTLIAYFVYGAPLANQRAANVDGKGLIDLPDLSFMISFIVTGKPALQCGP